MLNEFAKYFNQLNKGFTPSFSSNIGMAAGLVNTGVSGDPDEIEIKDSKGIASGKYSKSKIQRLCAADKAVGVDPYQALGIGLQENANGLKKQQQEVKDENGKVLRGRRGRGGFGNVTNLPFSDKENEYINNMTDQGYDADSIRLVFALKKKLDYAKQLGYNDPAAQLQAYNGYGVLKPEMFGGATKAYGVDITNGVDLKKNPLYGKRVLQLKSDLMNNKDLQGLLQ